MTKEERDDRPTLAIAERRARPKAGRFDRPLRDGRVFLHHFPALRAGPGVWPFFQALAPIFSGGGFECQIQGGGYRLEVSRIE
jgi:hypothetical protein